MKSEKFNTAAFEVIGNMTTDSIRATTKPVYDLVESIKTAGVSGLFNSEPAYSEILSSVKSLKNRDQIRFSSIFEDRTVEEAAFFHITEKTTSEAIRCLRGLETYIRNSIMEIEKRADMAEADFNCNIEGEAK